MGLFGNRRKSGRDTIAGTAQVVAVHKPIERARYVNCKLDLVVHAAGITPYQAQVSKKMLRWNRVPQPGMTIPVEVDPANPTDVDVVWDDLPDHDEVIASRSQQLITGTEPTPNFAGPGDSRIDQLERLAALHRSGALTDAEFAAEKQRIVGS